MATRIQNYQLPLVLAGSALFCFVACDGLRDQPIVISDDPTDTAGSSNAGKTGSSSSGGPSNTLGGAGGSDNPDENIGGLPSGGAPSLDGPPTVTMVTPADGAKKVGISSAVRVDFSEGLDEATVTADNISVKDGATAVAGSLEYQGGAVLFTPSAMHSLLTKYTLGVGTGVTDTTGNHLAAAFSSSFSTRDGAWQTESSMASVYTKLDNTSANAAMDAQGNALVVWAEADGNVYGRWYDSSQDTWGAITPLETRSGLAGNPRVAVAANGDAVVIFSVSTSPPELWARRYVNGAWEAAEQSLLKGDAATSFHYSGARVHFQNGKIVAVWSREVGSGNTAYTYLDAAQAGPTGAWKVIKQIDYSYAGSNNHVGDILNLTIDATGNAMVAYDYASMSTTYYPTFIRYTAATDLWNPPAPVRETNAAALPENNHGSYGPVLAQNAAGDAMMAWVTPVAGVLNLVASRFTRTGGWEQPVSIEKGDGNCFVMSGAVAAHGADFTVVWKQMVGSTFNAYRVTYAGAAKAWGDATLLSTGDTNNYFGSPNIVGDAHGNAMAAWSEGGDFEDSPSVTYSRYDALAGTWSAPGALTSLTDDGYSNPELIISSSGIIGAVLTNYNGPNGTWTGQRFNSFH